MEDVIILGTGCAGLTAAIYTARANMNPLVIEGSQPGGQLTTTSEVENFPGFPEGVDGFALMDNIRKQAARFGTRFTNDRIVSAELEETVKKLTGESGTTYTARTVIVATGASPRLLEVPGEKAMFGGKGVTTCATCDGAFYRDMPVVVIGGGDSAAEEALFLTRFASTVTLIHRRDELRASSILAERVLKNEKITVVWDTVVEAMLADEEGQARAVQVKNRKTGESGEIEAKGIFIAIGHIPNTAFLKGLLPTDENGYVIPEKGSQVKTRIPGVYCAGDVSDHVYRQAITAAGMGCQAAIDAERWLAEQPVPQSKETAPEATLS